MANVTEIISTVGFPIACVIALGYFIYLAWQKMSAQNEKREEKLYEIIVTAQANNDKLVAVNKEFVEVLETYKTDIKQIKDAIEDIKTIVKEN